LDLYELEKRFREPTKPKNGYSAGYKLETLFGSFVRLYRTFLDFALFFRTNFGFGERHETEKRFFSWVQTPTLFGFVKIQFFLESIQSIRVKGFKINILKISNWSFHIILLNITLQIVLHFNNFVFLHSCKSLILSIFGSYEKNLPHSRAYNGCAIINWTKC
jgi:hypothetical protein